MHPSQQTTFVSVLHTYFYPPFGAQNTTVGQATMTNSMTNAFNGQKMKNDQMVKQDEYRKQTQQSHCGPPQQQDRAYGRNDNNKRASTTYGRDNYQDKRSRNDHGRSPSRDRSNSLTRSPRSPGDNHRNGASFYEEKKKY
jgi:hypothetical protein